MNEQLTNLWGAVAIATTDRIQAALGHDSTAAALVLIQRYPGITIDMLGRHLQLSQSGAVRLVGRLATQGYVTRQRGTDRRFVKLELTPSGDQQATERLAQRHQAIATLLAPLSEAEQAQLLGLLTRLVTGHSLPEAEADHICRLCDIHACPLPFCAERKASL